MSADRCTDTISVAPSRATRSVDLEQRRGCRPGRADRTELLERGRHQRGRRALGALVEDVGADHDLERHHDDAVLGRDLRGKGGRRVGDHDDRPT